MGTLEQKRRSRKRWKDAHPSTYKGMREQQVRKRLELIRKAKEHPCSRCGGEFPHYVIDLHHRDRSDKLFRISAGRRWSIRSIVAEVAKCDPLCANCHREVEHEIDLV